MATLYGTAISDNERTEHFVNNFYLGARGTNATSTELQQQRDALNAAAAQGPSQVKAQAESFGRSLFAAQVNDAGISNVQFVTNLYEAFLQRGPDAGGLGWWSGQASVGSGRQNVLNAFATCGPFYELAGTLYREAFWLVADHLGTPRMIVNKSGTLAGVKRHDYLPFGEELYAGTGGRTTAQGYTGDSVRQHFTGYEADGETGLNFAQARYQSPTQGRFTSVDPLGRSANVASPQSFNRYSYVLNNPTNLTDPSGMEPYRGADQSWSDVSAGFWGSSFDFNGSHFGGPAIIQNGMDGFQDRQDDDANAEDEANGEDQVQGKNPDASTNNGNPTDIATDQQLAELFTSPTEGGIVRGASSARASDQTGDTHYKLGNGIVHTIHIYGNQYGSGIVGVYIPKGFTATYVGGDYNTVVATNAKTGVVIGIAHVNVNSQKALDRNMRTTNLKGSHLVGKLGGSGGKTPGNIHAHLSIFPSASARNQALAWKTAGKNQLRDLNSSVSRWLGDFRKQVRR